MIVRYLGCLAEPERLAHTALVHIRIIDFLGRSVLGEAIRVIAIGPQVLLIIYYIAIPSVLSVELNGERIGHLDNHIYIRFLLSCLATR